jgi:hypothetical protein
MPEAAVNEIRAHPAERKSLGAGPTTSAWAVPIVPGSG